MLLNQARFPLQRAQAAGWIQITAIAQEQLQRAKRAHEMKKKALEEEETRSKHMMKLLRDEEMLADHALHIALKNLRTQQRKLE